MNDTDDLILLEEKNTPAFNLLKPYITHAGHLGETKTKALRKSKVFFSNIDKITTPILELRALCKFVTPP